MAKFRQKQGKWQKFAGMWHITKMSEWDEEYCNMEVKAYTSINRGGTGEFQFGLVHGGIRGDFKKSGDNLVFDFTWDGQDELDAESGDGWMIVKDDGTAESLNHKGNLGMVEQLKGEICQLTQKHYKSLTVWKFVNNLYYRDVENLFRFVTDPEVSSTNNISERELRELVIIRNISKGSRSIKGANTTATLLSIIQTLRLNKQNVLLGLQGILNNTSRN